MLLNTRILMAEELNFIRFSRPSVTGAGCRYEFCRSQFSTRIAASEPGNTRLSKIISNQLPDIINQTHENLIWVGVVLPVPPHIPDAKRRYTFANRQSLDVHRSRKIPSSTFQQRHRRQLLTNSQGTHPRQSQFYYRRIILTLRQMGALKCKRAQSRRFQVRS